jgi:hypothetical protein
MTAGLAAWTKNEGWLVLIVVVLARICVLGRTTTLAAARHELSAFLFGLAPVLLVVLYFKIVVAPPNDLVSGQGWHETIPRLLAPARYVEVLRGFRYAAEGLGNTTLVNPLLVLLFYLVCVGIEPDERDRTGLATGLVALGLMVIGYGLVYLTTPLDVAWQVEYSANRLLMHLWPSTVFLAFLAACPPERSKG